MVDASDVDMSVGEISSDTGSKGLFGSMKDDDDVEYAILFQGKGGEDGASYAMGKIDSIEVSYGIRDPEKTKNIGSVTRYGFDEVDSETYSRAKNNLYAGQDWDQDANMAWMETPLDIDYRSGGGISDKVRTAINRAANGAPEYVIDVVAEDVNGKKHHAQTLISPHESGTDGNGGIGQKLADNLAGGGDSGVPNWLTGDGYEEPDKGGFLSSLKNPLNELGAAWAVDRAYKAAGD